MACVAPDCHGDVEVQSASSAVTLVAEAARPPGSPTSSLATASAKLARSSQARLVSGIGDLRPSFRPPRLLFGSASRQSGPEPSSYHKEKADEEDTGLHDEPGTGERVHDPLLQRNPSPKEQAAPSRGFSALRPKPGRLLHAVGLGQSSGSAGPRESATPQHGSKKSPTLGCTSEATTVSLAKEPFNEDPGPSSHQDEEDGDSERKCLLEPLPPSGRTPGAPQNVGSAGNSRDRTPSPDVAEELESGLLADQSSRKASAVLRPSSMLAFVGSGLQPISSPLAVGREPMNRGHGAWLRRVPGWKSSSKEAPDLRRLQSGLVRDSFHDNRLRLLSGDRHNVDVLGPYARLQLHVREAKSLVASDRAGLKSPFVEAFINDTSKARSSSCVKSPINPVWDSTKSWTSGPPSQLFESRLETGTPTQRVT